MRWCKSELYQLSDIRFRTCSVLCRAIFCWNAEADYCYRNKSHLSWGLCWSCTYTDSDLDADSDADSHTNPDFDANDNTDIYANVDLDANTHFYANVDLDVQPADSDVDKYPDVDADSYPNFDANPDADVDKHNARNAYADIDPNTYSNTINNHDKPYSRSIGCGLWSHRMVCQRRSTGRRYRNLRIIQLCKGCKHTNRCSARRSTLTVKSNLVRPK